MKDDSLKCKNHSDQVALNKLFDAQLKRIEDLARESDKRYEQRFQAQEAATTRAQEVGNEFRGSLDDLSVTKMPRTEAEQRNQANSDKIYALERRFNEAQKPNYLLWCTVVGLIFILVGASYQITDLRTQVALGPVIAQNQVSITDRTEMHSEVNVIRQDVTTLIGELKSTTQKLSEVETQFKAANDMINTHFAEQQRMNNIFMQVAKTGITYPAGPFYFPQSYYQQQQ